MSREKLADKLADKHQREWEELKRRQRKELKQVRQDSADTSGSGDENSASEDERDSKKRSTKTNTKTKTKTTATKTPKKGPRSATFYDYDHDDGSQEEQEEEEEEQPPSKKEKSVSAKKSSGKKVTFKKQRAESKEDEGADEDDAQAEREDQDQDVKDRRSRDHRYKQTKEAHDKMLGRVPTRKALGLVDLMDKVEPKKPANPFFLFKKEIEPQLISSGALDKSADVTQRSKIVSQQWKLCSPESKDKYERKYRANLVAYRDACDLYEAKVWVAAQMEDHIKEYQRGALHEKQLDEYCRDFFQQWKEKSRSEKDSLKLSRKRRVRKTKKVINKASLD
jgi:hypothetical protein